MNRSAVAALAALALIFAFPSLTLADEEGDQLRAIIEKWAPSICTLKVTVRRDMGMMGSEENTEEHQGVVVAVSGLVVMSNSPFADQSLGGMGMGIEIKSSPLDFKVIFGNEEKEYAAFLSSKDPDLNIAFVQIEDLEGRAITPIDFSQAAKPQIGDKLAGLSRMGRGYDYAPFFNSARVSGRIKKPRKAWMVDGEIGGMGLPAFTLSGELVGLVTSLKPTVSAEPGGFDLMSLLSALGGIPFVVPAKTVEAKLQQALPEAARMLAERKEAAREGADTDAEGHAHDDDKNAEHEGHDHEGHDHDNEDH